MAFGRRAIAPGSVWRIKRGTLREGILDYIIQNMTPQIRMWKRVFG